MYSHILISTDGSELAQRGIDHGLSLAKALGSKVTVFMATAPFPPVAGTASAAGWIATPGAVAEFEAQQNKFADAILAGVQSAASKMGVEVHTAQTSHHSPAVAIIDTARSLDCALIVMSSHGRRGIGKLLLGSQTSEVLATAHIPVLVIR